MKRKIVQFELNPTNGNIVALASDGSMWVKTNEWFRIADLPPAVEDDLEHEKPAPRDVLSSSTILRRTGSRGGLGNYQSKETP